MSTSQTTSCALRLRTLALATIGFIVLGDTALANCSVGAWSGSTGNPQPLGASTAPKGEYIEGQCGLTVDAASLPAYVSSDTPLDESLFSARFYLNPGQFDLSSGAVSIFKARDGGTTQVELQLQQLGSDTGLSASYRSNGQTQQQGDVFLLNRVWQAIELSWSATDGTFSLAIDGRDKFSLTGLSLSGEVVNEVDLGGLNAATASGKLVFDAFEMRRTADTPPLLEATQQELSNISTRAKVLTGDDIAIAGFIIEGGSKCVVIRARGPSLAQFGVPSPLPNPYLRLTTLQGALLAENDDWMSQANPNHVTVIQDLGLADMDTQDASLYSCLDEGLYTALLSGSGNETGIGIIEVFDADTGLPFMSNISTRAKVGTGDDVTIAGFIIEGDTPRQVLILGRGPSLAQYGVPGVLQDPTLTLTTLNGTGIAENDNWRSDDESALSATGLAPEDDLEAAILITLDPGLYTAILQGYAATTGVAIVEVFDLTGR